MFDGLLIADHRAPVASLILSPKNCENCRRPFLRRSDSSVKFCNPCRQMYSGEYGDQLWGCSECRTERAWGTGHPEETRGKQLHCNNCAAVTDHAFSRMANPNPGVRPKYVPLSEWSGGLL